jgi:deoxycytidylate deaminase
VAKKGKLNASINYPYLHPMGSIKYVAEDNKYMQAAKKFAKKNSLDRAVPTGTVLVLGGRIIGRGANGSDYHDKYGCERVRLNIPTGQGYELCEGCHPKNHSEVRAIENAKAEGKKTEGAEAYLWGHWWCCEDCWNAMIKSGVTKVNLMASSELLFNKLSPQNVIGRQFA